MLEKVDRTYTKDEVMGLMEPLISTWFNERFDDLTIPQAKAIPVIHQRRNVLVSSPTGSGKTLTAFTSIINELTRYSREGTLEERVYCIYVSPLKALANDVNRNLNTPLAEMREVAAANGMDVPDIRVAVRSGDTPQNERQKMVRHPPHILITTPESLALILAAPKFKEAFDRVEWVIIDEIHDICDSKRGAFLSLTLERLRHHCKNDFVRIGLSATLAPIDAIAGYLVGCEPDGSMRDVALIESGSKKQLDLKVICPTEDMTTLSSDIVNSMMYDTLKELIDQHETTLVFTNTRSGAESVVYKLKERGLENIEVHHSSLGKESASCRPHHWSWASTSGPWTWFARSAPPNRWPRACRGSVAAATDSGRWPRGGSWSSTPTTWSNAPSCAGRRTAGTSTGSAYRRTAWTSCPRPSWA